MKTYYSAEDIENLAAMGQRELHIDEETVLTDLARDAAAQLGVRLISGPRGAAVPASRAPGQAAPVGNKPRGCQHPPLGDGTAGRAQAGGSPVIDELVNVVKQLGSKK